MTKAAVIIPVMNRAAMICRVLDCVAAQTLAPRRLIVVDDASDDDTPTQVRRWFAAEKPAFATRLLVHETNRGAPAARNRGLAEARDCEFVHFLDSDDFPPPDFLEKTQGALEAAPRAVAATSDRLMCYGLATPQGPRQVREFIDQRALAANPWRWFFVEGAGVASCTLLRARCVRELGGFNEALPTGHDSELFTRMANLGAWLHVPDCVVTFTAGDADERLHRRHDDYLLHWARIREDCLERFGAREHVPAPLRRRVLGRSWCLAGMQMIARERFGDARDCLRKSLARRPSPRNHAWALLAILPLLRLAMPLLKNTRLGTRLMDDFSDHFSHKKRRLLQ